MATLVACVKRHRPPKIASLNERARDPGLGHHIFQVLTAFCNSSIILSIPMRTCCGVNTLISKISNSPVPDIKANGSDAPITITTADMLNLTVTLNPGADVGVNADWWALAGTPMGWFYYDEPSNQWLRGQLVTYQGPIFNLAPFTVLHRSGLPVGIYTISFEMDTTMNGVKDTPIFSDSVVVTVQ